MFLGSTEANKVGTVSWWICVIIASLVIIVIIIGIVGCKKAVSISCKPCINRLVNFSLLSFLSFGA